MKVMGITTIVGTLETAIKNFEKRRGIIKTIQTKVVLKLDTKKYLGDRRRLAANTNQVQNHQFELADKNSQVVK